MPVVTIQEAKISLSELIHCLAPGDDVVITEDNRPVARLVATAQEPTPVRRQLGTLRETVLYVAPDFDAPLEDFAEYAL
ncbi:MAG: type II toxin-antitoxin system prevent-host-death family antitoxin [Tepidisphaeraceae bacterium]